MAVLTIRNILSCWELSVAPLSKTINVLLSFGGGERLRHLTVSVKSLVFLVGGRRMR